jgi:hypothetical protein
MPLTTAHILREKEIQAAVERVEAQYVQQVDYINFDLDENRYGDPCINFRIVLRDEGSGLDNDLDLEKQVAVSLMNEAKADEYGFRTYFDTRTAANQAKHPIRGWARNRAAS